MAAQQVSENNELTGILPIIMKMIGTKATTTDELSSTGNIGPLLDVLRQMNPDVVAAQAAEGVGFQASKLLQSNFAPYLSVLNSSGGYNAQNQFLAQLIAEVAGQASKLSTDARLEAGKTSGAAARGVAENTKSQNERKQTTEKSNTSNKSLVGAGLLAAALKAFGSGGDKKSGNKEQQKTEEQKDEQPEQLGYSSDQLSSFGSTGVGESDSPEELGFGRDSVDSGEIAETGLLEANPNLFQEEVLSSGEPSLAPEEQSATTEPTTEPTAEEGAPEQTTAPAGGEDTQQDDSNWYDVLTDPTGGTGEEDSIICTESMKQGFIDSQLISREKVINLRRLSQDTFNGYHYLAIPIVRRMRKDKEFARKMAGYAEDYCMFVTGDRYSIRGELLQLIGEPICWIVGKIVGEQDLEHKLYA